MPEQLSHDRLSLARYPPTLCTQRRLTFCTQRRCAYSIVSQRQQPHSTACSQWSAPDARKDYETVAWLAKNASRTSGLVRRRGCPRPGPILWQSGVSRRVSARPGNQPGPERPRTFLGARRSALPGRAQSGRCRDWSAANRRQSPPLGCDALRLAARRRTTRGDSGPLSSAPRRRRTPPGLRRAAPGHVSPLIRPERRVARSA